MHVKFQVHVWVASVALSFVACNGTDKASGKPAAKPADPHTAVGVPATNPHAVDAQKPAFKVPEPINPTEVTPTGTTKPDTILGLKLAVPEEWTRREPKSNMRAAEYVLPGPGGEVEMTVFRFPGGGDVNSNIQRWKGQFQHPDGTPIAESELKVDTTERAPLKLTTVELAGTNVAPVRPGSPERYHQPDAKMFAVIVEGDGDPYFFKVVGAAKTIDVWATALPAMAASIGKADPA